MWTLIYGGASVQKYATFDDVEAHQAIIDSLMKQGGGWFSLSYPKGDGLAQSRYWISPGIPIAFVDE